MRSPTHLAQQPRGPIPRIRAGTTASIRPPAHVPPQTILHFL